MKQSFLLALLCLCSAGCHKNHSLQIRLPEAPELSEDYAFVRLNDAANHLDPYYVLPAALYSFPDNKRRSAADSLWKAWLIRPEDTVCKQALSAFYHLPSTNDFDKHLADIRQGLLKLERNYGLLSCPLTGRVSHLFADARKRYARNKIENYPAIAPKMPGKWADFVQRYFNEFDYMVCTYDFAEDSSRSFISLERLCRLAGVHP